MENKEEKGFTRSQANAIVQFFEINVLLRKLGELFNVCNNFHIKKETNIDNETMKVDYEVKVCPTVDNIKIDMVVHEEGPVEVSEDKPFIVYVMVGVAGAGKDTWIKENVPDLPVLSRDIVRKEIGLQGEKTVGTKAQEELVTKIINERMDDFLIRKQSFVVNNMHLVKKYRDAVKERVRPYGPKLIYVYVKAPTPEVNKIRRDGQIKPEEIDSMYRRLQKPRKEECDELIEWIQHNNPQRVIDELADILCPYCPWTLNEVSKPRIGTCEGSYCEEAYQRFYDTTKD